MGTVRAEGLGPCKEHLPFTPALGYYMKMWTLCCQVWFLKRLVEIQILYELYHLSYKLILIYETLCWPKKAYLWDGFGSWTISLEPICKSMCGVCHSASIWVWKALGNSPTFFMVTWFTHRWAPASFPKMRKVELITFSLMVWLSGISEPKLS